MKVGDMVTWAWMLHADSWEPTRFQGVILKVSEVSNGTVLHVLDNTGQQCMVRADVTNLEVISESR